MSVCLEVRLFERKSSSDFKSMPSAFKKMEWKLAEELNKLEQQSLVRRDQEFSEKLMALVEEYAADPETVAAAVHATAAECSAVAEKV